MQLKSSESCAIFAKETQARNNRQFELTRGFTSERSKKISASDRDVKEIIGFSKAIAKEGKAWGTAGAEKFARSKFLIWILKIGQIFVQRSLGRKGKIKTPKSGKSPLVDMSKQLASLLAEFIGTRKTDELLFPSETGTHRDLSNFYKEFQSLLSDSQLRAIRFHDLRHLFATLHIKNNQNLAYIRDQLGHSSIEITVQIYGHLVPGYNRSAADMLDD